MVYASEVYQWFKELAAHSRIEFTCSIIQLCIPSEQRFISTLLEDMNNKDYPSLRDTEERCNSPSEFSQYPHKELNSEHIHKLCLSLSLLKPTNQFLAQNIFEILMIHFNYLCQCVMLNSDLRSDIMLLYALASYHPAFAFQSRHKLAEHFKTLLDISNENVTVTSNSNNSAINSVSADLCQSAIKVTDVFIEKTDAVVIVKMVLEHKHKKYATKRICLYSKMKQKISTIFSADHELHKTIVTLSYNGNFTPKNIYNIFNKIILFTFSNPCSDQAKKIKDFFNYLPLCTDEQLINSEKYKVKDNNRSILSDNTPKVFQKNSYEFESSTRMRQKHESVPEIEENIKSTKALTEKKCTKNVLEESIDKLFIGSSVKDVENCDNIDEDCGSDKKSLVCKEEKIPSDKEYLDQNLCPLNILGMPYPPRLCYYLPNYQNYTTTNCCISSNCTIASKTTQESSNIPSSTDMIASTRQYSTPTFLPYHLHPSNFTPIQFFYHPLNVPFHVNENYTSILTNNGAQPFPITSTPSRSMATCLQSSQQPQQQQQQHILHKTS